MTRKNQEYSWLDDAFKETKEQDEKKMSGSSKAFIGLGCLAVVILLVIAIVMAVAGMANVVSSL